jgi:S-formylglutathione hydrolase FrmB
MAFFQGNLYSRSMLMETQVGIILPQDGRRYGGEGKPKTLVLLHGLSDNASGWQRRSAVERYAERYDLAVVMPEVQRSWYQDMAYGQRMYSYIAHELPELASKLFHLSISREDLMIAGLSMGGYGALRCAFENPERFGFCGAFSGGYDLRAMLRMVEEPGNDLVGLKEDFQGIFGVDSRIPERSTTADILRRAAAGGILPKLYMVCGRQDFLYPMTTEVRRQLAENHIDHIYEEWDGFHEWDVWDAALEKMLRHFLGDGRMDWGQR